MTLKKITFDPEMISLSRRSINQFGDGVQAMKAIEEFSECIDAIAKASKPTVTREETLEAHARLVDETVDAWIVVHHLVNIAGVKYCEERLQEKLTRLRRLLAGRFSVVKPNEKEKSE